MPHTAPLLDPSHTKTASPSLIERIAAYPPCTETEHQAQTADRWLLASNLQKAIRRGLSSIAIGTAARLIAVDPRYFWRRLLVIAYEDVGYGDINLCHDLLKTFRREALQRDLGPVRVAQYFAHELASACKSRSLCDALAMLEFWVGREQYEQQFFGLSDDQLLHAACDSTMPVLHRIAALRHICGYGLFANGRYKSLSPPRRDLMIQACISQGLTEVETTLFRSGQNVAESLNIPIPIIGPMVRSGPKAEQKAGSIFEGTNNVLYAALDRHTRIGKRCFARLAREVASVRGFFTHHPALDPVAVLGIGVFITEGAALDRWLVFKGSDSLRQDFDQNFLEHAGVTGEAQKELLELVSGSLEQLNHIRAQEFGK